MLLILNNHITPNKDKFIGYDDDKQRKYYQGKKGGIYYQTKSGKKKYVKNINGLSFIYKNTDNQINKKEKYTLKESIFGTDDKGRNLYQGKRGGIYYKTSSGNKVYIKKKI